VHTRGGKQATIINANALLGFGFKEDEGETEKVKKPSQK
jgi:hypothetical protein